MCNKGKSKREKVVLTDPAIKSRESYEAKNRKHFKAIEKIVKNARRGKKL